MRGSGAATHPLPLEEGERHEIGGPLSRAGAGPKLAFTWPGTPPERESQVIIELEPVRAGRS